MLLLVAGCALVLRTSAQDWTFMVYGDSRGSSSNNPVNTAILTELAQVTTNLHPAFVLVPGDLVNKGSLWAFQQWTNIMSPVYQAGIGVYPVLGNHDRADVTSYKNIFGPSLPDNGPAAEIDRTYALFYSNAVVLALDQYVASHRVNQAWINSVLATNACPHIFALGHEPAFKVNHTGCLDDYPANRNAFWNSLSNAGSRIYFCGHDHFYDHMRLDDGDGSPDNDVHQMIVGTAGAPLYASGPYDGDNGLWMPQRILFEQQHGFVLVEVRGWSVTNTWYHRTGANTYSAGGDVFGYTWRTQLRASLTNDALILTWIGGGTLQATPDFAVSFTNVSGATSPWMVTNLAATPMFFRVEAP